MTESQSNARMETNVVKVQGVDPNFLAKYTEEDHSLDTLKEHRIVPRLKIIQAPSDINLKAAFGEGSLIVRPGDTLICKFNAEPKTFKFVPLFFFVEYAKWLDLKDANSKVKGPIVERVFDSTSPIAIKAKDPNKRREVYEGYEHKPENEKYYYRYVEHLRFIGLIYGEHPLVGTPITLSFERGEFSQGKNFISAIMLRRQMIDGQSKQVPLWAQVWQFSVQFKAPDANRKWYGLKFEAADPSIIQESEAEAMRTLNKEFKELFNQQRLLVQEDVADEDKEIGSVEATDAF